MELRPDLQPMYDGGMNLDRTIVQCSRGSYYETVWVPYISFKSIRLGSRRFQKCPVHKRWELSRMVPDDEWSPEIIAEARRHKDTNII